MRLPTAPRRIVLVAAAAAAVIAPGCGRRGAPLPPVVRVAERTRDLQVVQEGTFAVLTWSYPSMTRAGGPLPDLEAIEVWRLSLPSGQEPQGTSPQQRAVREQLLLSKGQRLLVLDRQALTGATHGSQLTVRDDLHAWYRENVDRLPLVVWYAVRAVCCRGHLSEPSNIVRLVPQAPPSPPTAITATPEATGIVLGWTSADGATVIVEGSADGTTWRRLTAEPVAQPPWRDTTARQGATSYYRLRSVDATRGLGLIGEPSKPLAVAYPDIYPPEPPENLVCLPEEGRVRLRWDAVAGSAEYRVFRRRPNGGWDHLDFYVQKLEYTDTSPPSGTATYAVKAVDSAGNESDAALCSTAAGPTP
jgi:hypothetical protein